MKPQCIVCDAVIVVPIDVQESEVLTCTDCKSRLVVESFKNKQLVLARAPQVEEDWGE